MTQESGECCCMAEFLPCACHSSYLRLWEEALGQYWEKRYYFSPKCCVPEIFTPHAPPVLGYHATKVKKNVRLSWIIQHLGDNPNPKSHLAARKLRVTPQPGIKQIPVAVGKHANSDFQLRQVQHSSASGVEAPFFASPEGVSAWGPRGSLCKEPRGPARAGRRNAEDLWVDFAASWMGIGRSCCRAHPSWKELPADIIHPSSVLSVQIWSQGVLEQHRTYPGKAAGIQGSLSAPWESQALRWGHTALLDFEKARTQVLNSI